MTQACSNSNDNVMSRRSLNCNAANLAPHMHSDIEWFKSAEDTNRN